jgi:hypothetical protein
MADILPEKIKKADFMQKVETRQDYNRELQSFERFSQRGAEKPVVSKTGNTVTKWEKNEVSLKVANVNRARAKEREHYNLDRPNMQMGTRKQNELKPKEFDFDKIRKGKEWELYKKTLEKQVKANHKNQVMEDYKKNYLANITNNLGEAGDELYDFISRVPADVLYEVYWEDDETLKIQFTSDPLPSQDIADETLNNWRKRLGLEEGEDYDDYLSRNEEDEDY